MSDDPEMDAAVKQVLSTVSDADEAAVRAEFEKYQKEFLIPPSDAMRSVLRRFQSEGSTPAPSREGGFRSGTTPLKKVSRLTELTSEDRNVEVTVEIVTHNVRTQMVRGQEREIAFGMLEDNPDSTGDGKRTRWSFKDWGGNKNLIPGVVVRVEGASVNEYNGDLSLNINQSSRVVVLKESSTPHINTDEPLALDEAGKIEGNVCVIGRVLSLRNDAIKRKDGGTSDVVKGRLGDDSGSLGFISWEPFTHEVGSLVKIERGQIRRFRDNPELNIGRYTKVEVYHDSGFSDIESLKHSSQVDIASLRDGARDVDVVVELVDWSVRNFTNREGEEGTVWEGNAVDPTGRCRVSSWSELPIDSSALPMCLTLSKVHIRSWQGVPQITINTPDQVEIQDKTPWESINLDNHMVEVDFSELVSGSSRAGIRTTATVISVRDDCGIILRCPTCRRVLRDGSCIEHDVVEGNKDLRLRLILDDGVSTASMFANKDATETFLEKSIAEIEAEVSDKGQSGFVSELRQSLLGHKLRIDGRSNADEQGVMIFAELVEQVEVDAVLAATEVRAKWGVV
ncbi:MAG: hypothetical protein CMI32_06215 [Opitutales bacterium]|jgi:ssDNA-binding replication factor A large subunit|nr:hypothetical protein [Opitutales bacterium]MDP7202717.1 hypothetical protein [Candidatus Poseidoniaceae archaeon]